MIIHLTFMEALEIYSPDTPLIRRDNGLLTPPHKQTHIHVVQHRHNTATYQYREDRHCGQTRQGISPPKRAHDMITVCLLLFRALILNSTRTSRRLNLRPIKKTRWKKSRQVKGTWLISDRMRPSYPQFHRFFPHFKRLLRRREHVPRPLTRVPFYKVKEWDRGFYTSREMTGRVCFSFRLSGISILTFRWPTNTK